MKLSALTSTKIMNESSLLQLKQEDYHALIKLLKEIYHELPTLNLLNWDKIGSAAKLGDFEHESLKEFSNFINDVKGVVSYIKSIVTMEGGEWTQTENKLNARDAIVELKKIATNLGMILKILSGYQLPIESFAKIKTVAKKAVDLSQILGQALAKNHFAFDPSPPKAQAAPQAAAPQKSIADMNKDLIKYRQAHARPGTVVKR